MVEGADTMSRKPNDNLIPNAKTLRKNMTPEERILWYDFLCRLPMRVRKQSVIKNYIVDFYIEEKKIVIELDGSQHYREEHRKADKERDANLKEMGMTVLRYDNSDVKKNKSGVCGEILRKIGLTWDDLLPKKQ